MRIMRNRSIWKCPYSEKFPRKCIKRRHETLWAAHYVLSNLMIALQGLYFGWRWTIIASDESWIVSSMAGHETHCRDRRTKTNEGNKNKKTMKVFNQVSRRFQQKNHLGTKRRVWRPRMCHMSREMRNLQQAPAATMIHMCSSIF